jgi:hypothetical protein
MLPPREESRSSRPFSFLPSTNSALFKDGELLGLQTNQFPNHEFSPVFCDDSSIFQLSPSASTFSTQNAFNSQTTETPDARDQRSSISLPSHTTSWHLEFLPQERTREQSVRSAGPASSSETMGTPAIQADRGHPSLVPIHNGYQVTWVGGRAKRRRPEAGDESITSSECSGTRPEDLKPHNL